MPDNASGCASSTPGRTPRFGWRSPDTMLNVTHTDGYPVVPAQAKSVILGMGERVDATITVNSSVPVVAVPEGKQGHAQLNLRVDNAPSTVNVDDFVAAVRNGGGARHRDPVADPGRHAARAHARPDHRGAAERPGERLHVADQRQALRPAEQRHRGETRSAGADPDDQRIHDVPPDSPARAHLRGGGAPRSPGPEGHRAGAAASRPWRSTSTPTTRASGSPTATTPITWRPAWPPGSSTRASALLQQARGTSRRAESGWCPRRSG